MATFYFNGAADLAANAANPPVYMDWQTLGNWWMNAACTVPATGLPTSTDDVVLLIYLMVNSGSAITVANLTIDENCQPQPLGGPYPYDVNNDPAAGTWYDVQITVTGLATVNAANVYIIDGDAVFNGNAYNYNRVLGDATFNDLSGNASQAAYWFPPMNYNPSNNAFPMQAHVEGNATFNHWSWNMGYACGVYVDDYTTNTTEYTATFNDDSLNGSPWSSYWWGWGDYYNHDATVFGYAVFNDRSLQASFARAAWLGSTFNDQSMDISSDYRWGNESPSTYNGFTGMVPHPGGGFYPMAPNRNLYTTAGCTFTGGRLSTLYFFGGGENWSTVGYQPFDAPGAAGFNGWWAMSPNDNYFGGTSIVPQALSFSGRIPSSSDDVVVETIVNYNYLNWNTALKSLVLNGGGMNIPFTVADGIVYIKNNGSFTNYVDPNPVTVSFDVESFASVLNAAPRSNGETAITYEIRYPPPGINGSNLLGAL